MKKATSFTIKLVYCIVLLLYGCSPQAQEDLDPDLQTNNVEVSCPKTSDPWDVSWITNQRQIAIANVNSLLSGTGLAEEGETIINLAIEYQVNPAFALAMFRKEASFAALNTRAFRNNNPGNINATGDCKGKPENTACNGLFGEISTDGRFGKYSSVSDGIKAYFVLLSASYSPESKRACQDITCIISAYAPSSENDTQKYIQQVINWTQEYQCKVLGVTNPTILSSAPTLPYIAVTLNAATVAPEQSEENQFGCTTNNLTEEEYKNCGIHSYLFSGTVTGKICNYIDDTGATSGKTVEWFNHQITVRFSKDGVYIDAWKNTSNIILNKVSLNTYSFINQPVGEDTLETATITFNSEGFTLDRTNHFAIGEPDCHWHEIFKLEQ